MSVWKEYPLGEVAQLKRGFDLPQSKRIDGPVPIFSSSGISGCHNEYKVKGPGVITGRYGTIGEVFFSDEDFWPLNTTLFVEDFKGNDPRFIYYLLRTINWDTFVTASAVPGINRNIVHKEIVKIPDVETQRRVANILLAFDKKIDINNGIINTLQKQGTLLYSSWFERYEPFADADINEKSSSIPEGWRAITLGDVTTDIRARVGSKDYPVFSALNTGRLIFSEDYFSRQVFSKDISKYIIVNENDFAYNPARINIGSIGRNDLGLTGCVSPVYVVVRTKPEYIYFFDFYFKSERFSKEVNLRASGSVRQSLKYSDFSLIRIILPPEDIIEQFNAIFIPMNDAIRLRKEENLCLSSMRDLTLNRIMSGEMTV